MNLKVLSSALLISITIFSCIPARQVEELQSKYDSCNTERKALTTERKGIETENNELKAEVEMINKSLVALRKDTVVMGVSLRKMTKQYEKINKLNDELLKKMADLQKGSQDENSRLLAELSAMEEDLQRREDELKNAEKELEDRKYKLNKLELDLQKAQLEIDKAKMEVAKREARVNELEEMLRKKDEAAQDLKNRLTEALLGFKDKGLSVEMKNGKIYVSMEAKLLFDKGSTRVDPNGKKVLIELAKALENEKDLEVLVEGHTDSDKLSGTGTIKDNWDLSVMRATSVVRIMLANSSLSTGKITAGGRGASMPIDTADTEAAKSKNRRIEVILTPNLDKLFEIIEAK